MSKEASTSSPPEKRRPSRRLCVAVVGDLVQSRAHVGEARRALQERLHRAVEGVNTRYAEVVLSRFLVTAGDEFQGLLRRCDTIPDLIWDLERDLSGVDVRLGFGRGVLETGLAEYAVGMDGPVWHRARAAIEDAESSQRLGGVFRGFGDEEDVVLSGLATLLRCLREDFSDKQREAVELLRKDPNISRAAEKLGITRQAAHYRAQGACWDAFREGESAWRKALAKFDYTSAWGE